MSYVAFEHPLFQPAVRVIQNITNANPAVVTTTFAHNYFSTDIIKLKLPQGFGMQQINGMTSEIEVLSPTTFAFNVDSTNFDTYSNPDNGQFAQTVPVAENTLTVRGARQNVAPSYVRS